MNRGFGSWSTDELYVVNWPQKKSRRVFGEMADFDLPRQGTVWGALDPSKSLDTLGKIEVWSRKIWLGDLRDGKRWTITPEVVYTDNFSISP